MRTAIALSLVCALPFCSLPASAQERAEIHYAPVENLERIDLDLLDSAEDSIDLAAFVLSDWAVIDSLKGAITRGVPVRILLDGTQRSAYDRLADIKDIVRVKPRKPIMHLKAYTVDGKILRTGSANFSGSGLKQQDNDMIVLRDEAAVAAFREQFGVI